MKKHVVFLFLSIFSALPMVIYAQKPLDIAPGVVPAARIPLKIIPEQASDWHFDAALDAFRNRKYQEASRQIMDGAEALRLEAPYTEAPGERKLLYQRLNDLVTLSEEVEAGKYHTIDPLLQAFNNAQLSVVHRYYLVSNNLIEPGGDDITQTHLENLQHHILADAKYQSADKAATLQALAQQTENLAYQVGQLKGKPLTPALDKDLRSLLSAIKALDIH